MTKMDDKGGSDLAPLVIFSVLFLALTLAVVPQMIDVFYANAANEGGPLDVGYSMIGGHQYQMWTTTNAGPIDNYTITPPAIQWGTWAWHGLNNELGNHLSNNQLANSQFFDSASNPPSKHRLYVWVVRNNTGYASHINDLEKSSPFDQTNGMRDFFFFREYAWSGAIWDNTHNFNDVVSFTTLLTSTHRVKDNANMSTCSVLGKYNITFFVGSTSSTNMTLEDALSSNRFQIQVGSDLLNLQSRSRIGMWNIVGDLFLFKAEELGMPVWLNMFISTILWICVGFAVVGIISRFIPTIPGL